MPVAYCLLPIAYCTLHVACCIRRTPGRHLRYLCLCISSHYLSTHRPPPTPTHGRGLTPARWRWLARSFAASRDSALVACLPAPAPPRAPPTPPSKITTIWTYRPKSIDQSLGKCVFNIGVTTNTLVSKLGVSMQVIATHEHQSRAWRKCGPSPKIRPRKCAGKHE